MNMAGSSKFLPVSRDACSKPEKAASRSFVCFWFAFTAVDPEEISPSTGAISVGLRFRLLSFLCEELEAAEEEQRRAIACPGSEGLRAPGALARCSACSISCPSNCTDLDMARLELLQSWASGTQRDRSPNDGSARHDCK